MKNKMRSSSFSSENKALVGKLQMGLLFYDVSGETVAMRYKWCDGVGFYDPAALSRSELVECSIDVADTKDPPAKSVVTPENLLLLGKHKFAWWVPAKRRRITIGKSTRKTWCHETLVFMVKENRLSVAELPSKRRPKMSTILRNSRYKGIDVHNGVMGACSVKYPKGPPSVEDIPEWERAFFCSKFNSKPHEAKQRKIGTLEAWLSE